MYIYKILAYMRSKLSEHEVVSQLSGSLCFKDRMDQLFESVRDVNGPTYT